MAGIFALFKAFADKRTDPLDRMDKILNRYQTLLEVEEARAARSREREKQAFKVALELRAHVLHWEKWKDDGFPDPPGPPARPENFDTLVNGSAHPLTGALGLV